jgi:type VI secretion system protein VasD
MFQGMNLRKLWIGLVVMTVAACAEPPPPPPPPTVVNVTVNGAADLNPNAEGRPSPTVVRVYYLVSDTTFKDVDFFQLFEQEAATLGADLAASDELMISPGASQAVTRELRDDVRFLGLAASYRDIESAVWRGVVAVPPNQTTAVQAVLGANSVALSASPAE